MLTPIEPFRRNDTIPIERDHYCDNYENSTKIESKEINSDLESNNYKPNNPWDYILDESTRVSSFIKNTEHDIEHSVHLDSNSKVCTFKKSILIKVNKSAVDNYDEGKLQYIIIF